MEELLDPLVFPFGEPISLGVISRGQIPGDPKFFC